MPSENAIAFEDAMVVTPANATLVRDLNLSVPAGTNLLVTGPNGSGKSSLFRVLGGLWPLSKGRIHKPGGSEGDGLSHDIFYVPQRPYVTLGTLEEQLIYPLVASGWRHGILPSFWVSSPVCLSGVVLLTCLLDRVPGFCCCRQSSLLIAACNSWCCCVTTAAVCGPTVQVIHVLCPISSGWLLMLNYVPLYCTRRLTSIHLRR